MESPELTQHRITELEARMAEHDVFRAVSDERQRTVANDIGEIKSSVANLSKMLVGLIISLFLLGVGAILTFVLAGGAATGS